MIAPVAFLLEGSSLLNLFISSNPIHIATLLLLLAASIFSWTVIFAKWKLFKKIDQSNNKFMRACRKATSMESVALATEQFRESPLVTVFEYGFEEVSRQVKKSRTLFNKPAVERTLQLGISEEITRLEKNMNWLATVASVTPFIGLFGTVWGIIDAFNALSAAGSASLRAVGPGIAEALVATAMGLFAAIPAAICYNYYGKQIRDVGGRMEDFALEFLNLAERQYEE